MASSLRTPRRPITFRAPAARTSRPCPPRKRMPSSVPISVTVNGSAYDREVEARLLLSDFLRGELGLTGTHVGCEHGVCGACTVLMDGQAVRSCLVFAVQADGAELQTVESLAASEDQLHPLQTAFRDAHGLQCGFCTPGILMTMVPFLEQNPHPTEDEVRLAISGNLCRCTGYANIVRAVMLAAERARGGPGDAQSIEPRGVPHSQEAH